MAQVESRNRATSDPDARKNVLEEIREPTAAMSTSYRALPPEHRTLLVALLDAPPGPLSERELTARARRHAAQGLPHSPADIPEIGLGAGRLNITLRVSGLQPDDRRGGDRCRGDRRARRLLAGSPRPTVRRRSRVAGSHQRVRRR